MLGPESGGEKPFGFTCASVKTEINEQAAVATPRYEIPTSALAIQGYKLGYEFHFGYYRLNKWVSLCFLVCTHSDLKLKSKYPFEKRTKTSFK